MNLSELTQKFDNYLMLNYRRSERTRQAYTNCFKKFIECNSRVYRMSNNDLKLFFIDFGNQYSISYYNQMLATVRIVFKIIGQPRKTKGINFIKDEPKMINILSTEEISNSLDSINNLKHKCIINLMYIGAMRISELQNLKLKDIDSENKRILIHKGKGNKSRCIPIGKSDINELREYYKKHKPQVYLFEGTKKGKRYSKTSIRKVVQKIKTNKHVYPHLLRHTALTNLIDNKHSTIQAQTFSGHKTAKSLERYYHLSNSALQDMTLSLKR